MPKYKIKIPDVNKEGILLSGAKRNENTFRVAGTVRLINRHVVETSDEEFYPTDEWFQTMTDMFDTTIHNIIKHRSGGFEPEYEKKYCFRFGKAKRQIFSKHKDEDSWIVRIYDPNDKVLQMALDALSDQERLSYEFTL